ncbi:hypothetical protein HanIR_Chr15g0780771 [Helianthus annuus]|nr:hypothetical protein HanIR_Chr15g0780771 [Helianthus annuus]
MVFAWLRSIRVPSLLSVNTPEVSLRGVSRFATHTTVMSSILLYQIPKNRLGERVEGVKKPILKDWSSETMVWPSVMFWFCVMVLIAVVVNKRVEMVKKMMNRGGLKKHFIFGRRVTMKL